ncbi:MAG TPA: SRPBCC family protein [Candidatus Dormibacteraeota bacterium]|jgi:carbon monoxide dehydrogenase subunit G|nr:SRPBCC family protein [Candidatus Dormibacteraeota bacterium]
MQIENSFSVGAPPERVFAFLLDVNRVVACVPGAELSEVVDSDTFKGKVRIKVGPVTVSYNGTATLTTRDEAARTATLQAEGRETTGSGSARATTTMSVTPEGEGSAVRLVTDFTVVGRVAQFGRGIMEEVSRKLVDQMGACIRTKLEAEGSEGGESAAATAEAPHTNGVPPAAGASRRARAGAATAEKSAAAGASGAATTESGGAPVVSAAVTPAPAAPAAPATAPPAPRPHGSMDPHPAEAVPVDALALARSVAVDRLKAAGPARIGGVLGALVGLLVLLRLRRLGRRHRRRQSG